MLEKIDCLREPVRNMSTEDKEKVSQYLKNLKKLSDIIFETLDSVPSNVSFSLATEDETKDVPIINVNLKKSFAISTVLE